MADVKTSTGGSEDETILYIPFAGRIDVEEIEKQQVKKTKKQKVVKAITEGMAQELKENKVNVIAEVLQELTLEEAIEEAKEWVKPQSEYTQVDWAAVNDPPEPGVTDVAATPTGVNVVRRGFTTLQMALAFRNSLRDPADYLIVEVRESAGFALEGPILCHYVAHKTEEL
jgi:hypothetical protein